MADRNRLAGEGAGQSETAMEPRDPRRREAVRGSSGNHNDGALAPAQEK
jgi:hypothetical protein